MGMASCRMYSRPSFPGDSAPSGPPPHHEKVAQNPYWPKNPLIYPSNTGALAWIADPTIQGFSRRRTRSGKIECTLRRSTGQADHTIQARPSRHQSRQANTCAHQGIPSVASTRGHCKHSSPKHLDHRSLSFIHLPVVRFHHPGPVRNPEVSGYAPVTFFRLMVRGRYVSLPKGRPTSTPDPVSTDTSTLIHLPHPARLAPDRQLWPSPRRPPLLLLHSCKRHLFSLGAIARPKALACPIPPCSCSTKSSGYAFVTLV